MKTFKSVLPKAAMIFIIFSVVCGIVYTGVVTGLAQLLFPDKANGSIIEVNGVKYGSELLAQQYSDEKYMWGANHERGRIHLYGQRRQPPDVCGAI